jgi:hypothetical protein
VYPPQKNIYDESQTCSPVNMTVGKKDDVHWPGKSNSPGLLTFFHAFVTNSSVTRLFRRIESEGSRQADF